MTKNFVDIGNEIGLLLREKNAAYGNAFEESEKVIRVLFPEGVPPEKYQDFLTITRIIDKLFRIATDKNAFNEDPWRDIAGYAILSLWSQQPAQRGIDLEEERESRQRDEETDAERELFRTLGEVFGENSVTASIEKAIQVLQQHRKRQEAIAAGRVFEFTQDEVEELVQLREKYRKLLVERNELVLLREKHQMAGGRVS